MLYREQSATTRDAISLTTSANLRASVTVRRRSCLYREVWAEDCHISRAWSRRGGGGGGRGFSKETGRSSVSIDTAGTRNHTVVTNDLH
jgi:hypothetical protein